MKRPYTLLAVLIALSLNSLAWASSPPNLEAPLSVDDQILELPPWEYDLKEYTLDKSKSTFTLTKGYSLLRGDAARRYDSLVQGTPEDPNTEALLVNHEFESQTIFNYYEDGYVSLDSWEELDAEELLKGISEATEQSNANRSSNNIAYLKIGHWLQKPLLNREKHTVSWVFEVMDGEQKYVNVITIKLGRKGYEKITWIGAYDHYMQSESEIGALVDHHRFSPGFSYADYSVGDKLAGLGIAGLVALTAGGNPQTKAGLSALLANLFGGAKKLILPGVIALGALGAYCRKLFGPKSDATGQEEFPGA